MEKIQTTFGVGVLIVLFTLPALAQQNDLDSQILQSEVKALRAEVTALREEVKILRLQMGQVLQAVQSPGAAGQKTNVVTTSAGSSGCGCGQSGAAGGITANANSGGCGGGCGGGCNGGCGGNAPAAASAVAKAPAAKVIIDPRQYDISLEDSPVLGPATAPVTIVEFADFRCGFCIKEYPKLKQVLATYPDQVRLVFKHYPLSFGKADRPDHKAAELAFEEGGSAMFWKMHDFIMTNNARNLTAEQYSGFAQQLKMDVGKFEQMMNADASGVNGSLQEDVTEGRKVGVSGTPSVFINGHRLRDRSLESYKSVINDILAKQAVAKS